MLPESAASFSRHAPRLRQAAESLSQRLPSLLVEAERVSATVAPGVHGRRRTGMGETFWQFRQYQAGDAADSIDWRQSARSRHLFVREQEWEAAESVWLWCDLSESMAFRSGSKLPVKWERAVLLTLALAALLVRGGERVALLGGGQRPGHRPLRHGDAHPLPGRCRRRARRRGAVAATAAPCAPGAAVRLSAAARAAEPAPGPVRGPGRARQPDADRRPGRGAPALRGARAVRGHGA